MNKKNPQNYITGSFAALALLQFKKKKTALVGLVILMLFFLMAVTSLFSLTPHDPFAQNLSRITESISSHHIFGTDDLGRDLFSRILYGARLSLEVGVGSILISLIIGLVFGSIAGYLGSWFDHLLMRVTDIFLALPTILFAMALLAVFEPSLKMIILVLGFLGWPVIARLLRSRILSVKEEEYILAARALGISDFWIIVRHILPNTIAPLLVAVTLGIAGNILAEAWLSFLGIGVPPPAPSWGRMINEGQAYLTTKPWICLFPGIAIFLSVMAINLVGDGLRDALDPRLKNE